MDGPFADGDERNGWYLSPTATSPATSTAIYLAGASSRRRRRDAEPVVDEPVLDPVVLRGRRLRAPRRRRQSTSAPAPRSTPGCCRHARRRRGRRGRSAGRPTTTTGVPGTWSPTATPRLRQRQFPRRALTAAAAGRQPAGTIRRRPALHHPARRATPSPSRTAAAPSSSSRTTPTSAATSTTGSTWPTSPDTPLLAADGGVVKYAGWCDCGLGYYVEIDHGNGFSTVYGHMARAARTSSPVRPSTQGDDDRPDRQHRRSRPARTSTS